LASCGREEPSASSSLSLEGSSSRSLPSASRDSGPFTHPINSHVNAPLVALRRDGERLQYGLSASAERPVRATSCPISRVQGMEAARYGWKVADYAVHYERVVTAVDGNTLTLDAPIVDAIEARFGGASFYRTDSKRISEVGIEDLRVEGDPDGSVGARLQAGVTGGVNDKGDGMSPNGVMGGH